MAENETETTQERDVQEEQHSQKEPEPPKQDIPKEESVETTSDEEDVKAAKEAGVSIEEFERTRKALAKANKEAQDRRHKLQEYEELGVDPEKIKSMLQEQRDKEIAQMEEERRYNELLDKMKEETTSKVEQYQKENENMKRTVEKYVRDNTINEAIAAEDGVPKLLQGIVRDRTKVVQDEHGDYLTVVLDEYGQESDMSVKDLVSSFKDDPDLGYAFKAPRVSGNGTSNEGSSKPPSSKPGPKKPRSKMSATEKSVFVDKHGLDEYKKLPM